jgi:hypothetical protein
MWERQQFGWWPTKVNIRAPSLCGPQSLKKFSIFNHRPQNCISIDFASCDPFCLAKQSSFPSLQFAGGDFSEINHESGSERNLSSLHPFFGFPIPTSQRNLTVARVE